LKSSEHAGAYFPQLRVNYIPGHNPDLVIFDDKGAEKERLDLIPYDRQANMVQQDKLVALHTLLAEKGFVRGEWRASDDPGAEAAVLPAQLHGLTHIPISSSWRYLRFTTMRIRDFNTGMVQAAAFEFVSGGSVVMPIGATNPGGQNPPNEGPAQLLAFKRNSKWLDKRIGPVIFDFGPAQSRKVGTPQEWKGGSVDGYRWATGTDPRAMGRDPVQWRLEGSNDAKSGQWTAVHAQEVDYPVPTERNQWILPLDISNNSIEQLVAPTVLPDGWMKTDHRNPDYRYEHTDGRHQESHPGARPEGTEGKQEL
jgi:hypothetical protein